jgi:CRISPR/Cas system-associated endoribonuclease Cas2
MGKKYPKTRKAVRIILKTLFWTGTIAIASTSPAFGHKIISQLIRDMRYRLKSKKRKCQIKPSYINSFYYLKEKGFIRIENRGGQIYISLTKEGRAKADKYQIDDLEIKKPDKWDGKWRIMIFDIQDKHKIKRETLRGKIKELGMFQLQKSVWVHPYDFSKEIKILRDFFGLTKDEMKIIIASVVEDDRKLKEFFKLF